MNLNKYFDGDFYKKRGHAVTAGMGFFYLMFAYIMGYPVDISFFADIAILTVTLSILPQIKLNSDDESESSNMLGRNIFGYTLLVICISVAVLDTHNLIKLDPLSKAEFFAIIATMCGGLFGVSKIEITRSSIENLRNNFNWKRDRKQEIATYLSEQGVMDGTIVSDPMAQEQLDEELNKLKTNFGSNTILAMMASFRGMCEVVGPEHNDRLLKLAKEAGFAWYTSDEIPWCAVMMNIVMHSLNLPKTNSAMAKSFLKWGRKVDIEYAKKNIGNVIAIFHRGSSVADPAGHVTVVESISPDNSYMVGIGGNQGNCVKSSRYSLKDWRFIEFRAI